MSRVSLVWATPEGDKLIAKMARVSNPANEDNHDSAPKLIRYLVNHKHWSPFEMASMCVEIYTERDIAAQILRHRSFSFQEFSTRYSLTSLAELPAVRRQDTKNRQNSIDDLPAVVKQQADVDNSKAIIAAWRAYNAMIDAGVAKECARRILPLCTPTRMYMCGNVRSWIHYIQVRTDPSTQLEHREIAEEVRDVFTQQYPAVAAALDLCP